MFESVIDQIVPILGILMIIAIVIGPLWIRSSSKTAAQWPKISP